MAHGDVRVLPRWDSDHYLGWTEVQGESNHMHIRNADGHGYVLSLRSEIQEWLAEHLARDDYGTHTWRPDHANYRDIRLALRFRHAHQALLFKLTWGGR